MIEDKEEKKVFTSKYCKWCVSEFTPISHNNTYCCKECARKAKKDIYYQNKYGIGYKEYMILLMKQNKECAICGTSRDKTNSDIAFAVDHNHITGEVRGLLCNKCNQALGLLGDNKEGLKKALNYLKSKPTGYIVKGE